MSFNPDGSAVCDLCHNKAAPGSPVYAPWPAEPDENDNMPANLLMICRHCLRAAVSLIAAAGQPCYAHAEPLVRLNQMRWYQTLDQIAQAEVGRPRWQLPAQRRREVEELIESHIRDLEQLDRLEDLGALWDTGMCWPGPERG